MEVLVLVELEVEVLVEVLVDVLEVLVEVLVDVLVELLVELLVDVHVKSLFPNKNSDILFVFGYDYSCTSTLRPSVQN